MTGFAARIRPTIGLHDPLMARALLLDDGRTKIAIVVCDLIGLTPAAVAGIRHRIARKSSIPAVNILISCTHTHSGPTSMPFRGVMGNVDTAWLMEAERRIVDLVAGLPAALQPAQLAVTSTHVEHIGYNRQDSSHTIDEELGILTVEQAVVSDQAVGNDQTPKNSRATENSQADEPNGASGAPIATLLNYGTHPVVLGPNNLHFSADYPGEVAHCLEQLRDGVGMFLQGTSGDVDPIVYLDRGWGSGTFEDTRQIGERLCSAALKALQGAPRTSDVTLQVSGKMLEIPLDPPPALETLAGLKAGFEADRNKATRTGDEMQEKIALAMLEWVGELEQAMADGTLQKTLPSELYLAGINDLRIIGVPFETYTDIGLAIKRLLQPHRVFFAGYANGLYGYCPTTWAKDQGGYGPDSSYRWFPRLLTAVGYGADDLIVNEAFLLASSIHASAGMPLPPCR